MVLKKQTIWLLTMLTLMVALSAYYLFSGENGNDRMTDADPYNNISMNGKNQYNELTNSSGIDITTTPTSLPENLFMSLRLERDQFRSQLMETYNSIVMNSKDNNAVAEASAKMEELDLLEGSESLVESLIKAKGYSDAVVYTQDNKVTVIVQKNDLIKEEAVSLINLVAKNMNVSGINVQINNVP